ncbi:UNVERIFIED_CONTAM: V/A-type H+-transporting ATPase subunit F [Acetivibrio alkalicellulosi]
MKTFLISDNIDTLTGMRLAGIKGVVVHEKNEILEAFESVINDKEIQIVLITEKLVDIIPDYIMNIRLNIKYPLIVEIPDRHGTSRGSNSVMKYIEESIGL